MKKVTLLKFAIALICASGIISCWDVNLEEDSIVLVSFQTGTLTEGMPGTATFDVLTMNIATSKPGTVVPYSDAGGTNPIDPPDGIDASVSVGSENRTLTFVVGPTSQAEAGTYYFRVVIDGVESNVGTLTIEPGTGKVKTVTVGEQDEPIMAGTQGTIRFPVITENIAVSEPGMVVPYSDAAGTIPTDPPVGVDASVSVGSENRTLTFVFGPESQMEERVYYFRVVIDGVQSNVATLVIGEPPVKTVTVGEQNGAIAEGSTGLVTFPVITENIAVSEPGTVVAYSDAGGTNEITPPTGVDASVSVGNANRTLTFTFGPDSQLGAGTHYFRVVINGIQSNVATLVVSAASVKTVTVGEQIGTLVEGTQGSVTFPVTTANIAGSEPGSVTWYTNSAGTTLSNAPGGINTSVTTGSANRTLTVSTAVGTAAAPAGTYYFRVTINGVQSNVAMFVVGAAPVKTVTVGAQIGTLVEGTQGSVTFPVTTANIAGSEPGSVTWYTNSAGTTLSNAPGGINTSVTTGSANRTLTVSTAVGAAAAPAGTYYFRVTINDVQSNVGTFVIGAAPVKTVTVGAQAGTIISGTGGTVTFPVTTANIANSEPGTIQWYSDPAGTIPGENGLFVTSASVSTGSANRTLSVTAGADNAGGTFYFRVTIDGVESNVGMLTIEEKIVKVGTQVGTVISGTEGTITFPVTTANIATSQTGTVTWYSDAAGTVIDEYGPSVVTPSVSTGSAIRTLTMTAGEDTSPGTYYFRVTIDDVQSNVSMFTIEERTVTVGAQVGTFTANTAGIAVTFPVATKYIEDLAKGDVQWYSDAIGIGITGAPGGLNTSVTTGSENRTLTVSTGTMALPAVGTYYFRVIIDDVYSNMSTLTVQ